MSCVGVLTTFVTVIVLKSDFSVAEVRWCADGEISKGFSADASLIQYNDELYACMKCPDEAKLVLLNELRSYECCNGSIASVGRCKEEGALRSCSVNTEFRCDGKKQCYDGQDEMGCSACPNGRFSCEHVTTGPQCLPLNKLCDAVKDCKGGEDETLCPYFGGWCDGYLCGGRHPKCLSHDQICDGVKNCVDGSDESNCQYCPNQFRCRIYLKRDNGATTGECIGRFRVCDGVPDCANKTDETVCHRWQSWSTWSGCGAETENCSRIRRRSCVNVSEAVVSAALCHGISDDFDENHIDVCPECLPETTTTTPPTPPSTSGVMITGNNSATPPLTVNQAGIPFDTGALIGTVVAGSLALIVLVFVICICICLKKGRTGFWRPPSKLPRPSSSRVPGVAVSRSNGLRPGEISHPYPIKDKPKVADRDVSSPSNVATVSPPSISPNGMDSGIEDNVESSQKNEDKIANKVGVVNALEVDGLKKAAAKKPRIAEICVRTGGNWPHHGVMQLWCSRKSNTVGEIRLIPQLAKNERANPKLRDPSALK